MLAHDILCLKYMSREFVGSNDILFFPGAGLVICALVLVFDEGPYEFVRETYEGPVGDFLRYLQENNIDETYVTVAIAIIGVILMYASQQFIETDQQTTDNFEKDDLHY